MDSETVVVGEDSTEADVEDAAHQEAAVEFHEEEREAVEGVLEEAQRPSLYAHPIFRGNRHLEC